MNISLRHKKDYIINAVENGWSVEKIDNNKYQFVSNNFRKMKGNRRSISYPILKKDLIESIFIA